MKLLGKFAMMTSCSMKKKFFFNCKVFHCEFLEQLRFDIFIKSPSTGVRGLDHD